MKTDDKTKANADDSFPTKMEPVAMMELMCMPTNELNDQNDLGIFSKLGRPYCTTCISSRNCWRHHAQSLWYQCNHWTSERLGVDRPSTIDTWAWDLGEQLLCCDANRPLSTQQTFKFDKNLDR